MHILTVSTRRRLLVLPRQLCETSAWTSRHFRLHMTPLVSSEEDGTADGGIFDIRGIVESISSVSLPTYHGYIAPGILSMLTCGKQ